MREAYEDLDWRASRMHDREHSDITICRACGWAWGRARHSPAPAARTSGSGNRIVSSGLIVDYGDPIVIRELHRVSNRKQ